MKYNPKDIDYNPVVNIVNMLNQQPQVPVTMGFLDFCAQQFLYMGLECETYDDTVEALQLLADLGAFFMYERQDKPCLTPK